MAQQACQQVPLMLFWAKGEQVHGKQGVLLSCYVRHRLPHPLLGPACSHAAAQAKGVSVAP